MKQFFKKIDFVTIILIVALVIVSYCYAQLKLFNKEYINFCGYTIFQVITGSMSGSIEINDIIIVKITDEISKDDIITYKNGENFVTHRVIYKDDNKIITKGDANNTEDSPITKKEVIGKAVFIISGVSIWIQVLKSPQVILAVFITILAIKLLLFNKKDSKQQKVKGKL